MWAGRCLPKVGIVVPAARRRERTRNATAESFSSQTPDTEHFASVAFITHPCGGENMTQSAFHAEGRKENPNCQPRFPCPIGTTRGLQFPKSQHIGSSVIGHWRNTSGSTLALLFNRTLRPLHMADSRVTLLAKTRDQSWGNSAPDKHSR